MSTPLPCTYKSVTIIPGEQFTLPPGAVLVSSSDINSISSTCPIPTDLEELECWILPMYGAEEAGCGTATYAENNAYLDGINVGSTFYSFPSPINADANGNWDYVTLVSNILAISDISGLFIDLNGNRDYDPSCRGGVTTLCFKAVESIANTIYIPIRTSLVAPSNSGIDTRAYVIPFADFNGSAKCTCSLT